MKQEKKLSAIWAINVLFQHINVIGEKPRMNTKGRYMINFTGQDIWQEPIADICSETKVVLFIIIIIISLKSTNICLKL